MPQVAVAVAAVASVAVGVVTAKKQSDALKDAEKARKESNRIKRAGEEIKNRAARRKAAREARIKRATLLQSAENTGVAGASGESGALSTLSNSLSNNIALQQSAQRASVGISQQEQKAANAEGRAQRIGLWGGVIQDSLSLGADAAKTFA